MYIYHPQVPTEDYFSDFVALELQDGSLVLKYETGGGLTPEKQTAVGANLDDGEYHHVSLIIKPIGAEIFVDSNNCSAGVSCYGNTVTSLNTIPLFSSNLFIGGVGMKDNASSFHLESEVSLISTIKSLRINHTLIEYANILNEMDVMLGVLREVDPCAGNSCVRGDCVDLWLTSTCSCPYQYVGEECEILTTAHLNVSSALYYNVQNIDSFVFEFSVTVQDESGLLATVVEV